MARRVLLTVLIGISDAVFLKSVVSRSTGAAMEKWTAKMAQMSVTVLRPDTVQ